MELQSGLSELPKAKGWAKPSSTLYQGAWIRSDLLRNVVEFQQQFRARDNDIVFASHPKSGTTWLKALLFSVVNRHAYTPDETPLLTENPHVLIPNIEYVGLGNASLNGGNLFATHVPYALMSGSIMDDGRSPECRVVYVCRNPLDTVVSFWKFATGGHPSCWPGWTLEECVGAFCESESSFGPFWDHVVGFWKASLEKPEKVFFLKYEDMLEDTSSQVKKIAEFVGFPFSEEEETGGAVDRVVELCSLKKMKELDVNKHGTMSTPKPVEFRIFFRKVIGDWMNHLTPSMVERVNKITQEKLHGSGLTFTYYSKNI